MRGVAVTKLARGRGDARSARRAASLLLAIVLAVAAAATSALADDRYRGRPLADVIDELRGAGLNVIYSSDVVRDDLVVTAEPASAEPRALLAEILAPLGLALRDGPSGALLVVRAGPGGFAVRGRVLSAETGEPRARALVSVEEPGLRTRTRPDGTFEIEDVPRGTRTLVIDALGYFTVTLEGVVVGDAPGAPLVVQLRASQPYVTELTVSPSRLSVIRQDQASRLGIDSDDVVLLPTIGGDVSRVVEQLPGVSAPDSSAAFSVRGSEVRDVSLVLDGFELYEAFHLESFQTPFSMIDADIVNRIDFFGGGFTADFGDRHGGLVRMATNTVADPYRTEIEVGSINARVSHHGPLSGGKGSWFVSGRSWYPEAVRDTIELGDDGLSPRFQDVYAKLTLGVSPRSVLSVHSLLAHDRLDFIEIDGDEVEKADALNTTGYVWVRSQNAWSDDVVTDSVLSLGRIDRRRSGISALEDAALTVSDDRDVDIVGLRSDAVWRASDTFLLRGGVDVRWLGASYDYTSVDEDGSTTVTDVRTEPSGTSVGAYVAGRFALGRSLAAELGLRWDRQTYTNDNQLSPRINAIWRTGERSELRLGLGRYTQSQRIHELRIEDGEDGFQKAERSDQVAATFQQRTRSGLRLRADAYYRDLKRLHPRWENPFNPVELFPETEPDRVRIAPERARSRGLELLVRSDPDRTVTWWASYALSTIEDVIDGADVPRRWDQTNAVKFLVGYRPDDRWSFSLSGSAHTGWPTTPVTGRIVTLPGGMMEVERVDGPRNSDRFETYARLDLKLARSFALERGRLRIELEVVNLTDRNNICCVDEFFFDPQPDGSVDVTRETDNWLGITPSLSVLWEF